MDLTPTETGWTQIDLTPTETGWSRGLPRTETGGNPLTRAAGGTELAAIGETPLRRDLVAWLTPSPLTPPSVEMGNMDQYSPVYGSNDRGAATHVWQTLLECDFVREYGLDMLPQIPQGDGDASSRLNCSVVSSADSAPLRTNPRADRGDLFADHG